MIEKLIDLLEKGWEYVSPCTVVEAFQGAAILRWGVYHRTLGPGFHWKWPLAEVPWTVETCVTTLRLPPQTLTTKDDVGVVVAAIVKFQITNLQPYVCEIWDQRDVLADVTMGAIRAAVGDVDYVQLRAAPPEDIVVKSVRAECNRYGFRILKITFTDLGRVLSLRLMQHAAKDLEN